MQPILNLSKPCYLVQRMSQKQGSSSFSVCLPCARSYLFSFYFPLLLHFCLFHKTLPEPPLKEHTWWAGAPRRGWPPPLKSLWPPGKLSRFLNELVADSWLPETCLYPKICYLSFPLQAADCFPVGGEKEIIPVSAVASSQIHGHWVSKYPFLY